MGLLQLLLLLLNLSLLLFCCPYISQPGLDDCWGHLCACCRPKLIKKSCKHMQCMVVSLQDTAGAIGACVPGSTPCTWHPLDVRQSVTLGCVLVMHVSSTHKLGTCRHSIVVYSLGDKSASVMPNQMTNLE